MHGACPFTHAYRCVMFWQGRPSQQAACWVANNNEMNRCCHSYYKIARDEVEPAIHVCTVISSHSGDIELHVRWGHMPFTVLYSGKIDMRS